MCGGKQPQRRLTVQPHGALGGPPDDDTYILNTLGSNSVGTTREEAFVHQKQSLGNNRDDVQ